MYTVSMRCSEKTPSDYGSLEQILLSQVLDGKPFSYRNTYIGSSSLQSQLSSLEVISILCSSHPLKDRKLDVAHLKN